jgi:hypothetical protein
MPEAGPVSPAGRNAMTVAKVVFRATRQDWEREMRAYRLGSHQRTNTVLAALLPFALLGGLAVGGASPAGDPILWLSPLFLLSAVFDGNYFTGPRRTARRRAQDERQQKEILFEVGDEGVRVKDDYIETRFQWRNFGRVLVTEEFYFLVMAGNADSYHFIPRRVFVSEDEERGFRDILAAHIPDVMDKDVRRLHLPMGVLVGLSGLTSAAAAAAALYFLAMKFL